MGRTTSLTVMLKVRIVTSMTEWIPINCVNLCR